LTTVFDYSGTLSLDAVAFSQPDYLTGELYRSGLADFGLAEPDAFWDRIVNPTWEEGSRGAVGYRHLLVREISAGWSEDKKKASLAALERAAAMFVAQYLSFSRIHPAWRPLLTFLYAQPSVAIVVATDHYAEATAAIQHQFESLQMQACPLTAAAGSDRGIYIANSADLGCRTDQEDFWRRLQRVMGAGISGKVLLIDDFGGNETPGDHYGRQEKVALRRRQTEELLALVFCGRAEVLPFFLSGAGDRGKEAQLLIDAITIRIRDAVAGFVPVQKNGSLS